MIERAVVNFPRPARDRMARWTRRGFVAGATTAAIGGSCVSAIARTTCQIPFFKKMKLPIGIQLYSLGPDLAADLDGQLAALAAIGYRTVEISNLAGRTPAQLRAAFDRAGLACHSAHVPARATGAEFSFQEDMGRLAEQMHILGIGTVILPTFYLPDRFNIAPLPGENFGDVMRRVGKQMSGDDWKYTADVLNRKGKALAQYGLRIGYHNHNFEFAPVGSTSGMEMLLSSTDPNVVTFEMDVGWILAAGRHPLALLEAFPRRFRLVHIKDIAADTAPNYALYQDPTDVGSGIADWPRLLKSFYKAGIRQFFVEREPPFSHSRLWSARKSFDYLNSLVVSGIS